jgi:sugar phosphate isomerase/epimerase
MEQSRRSFLRSGAGFALATPCFPRKTTLRVGVTDWSLQLAGKIEAIGLAARLGFDGVQVSLGRVPVDNRLPMDNPDLQAQFVAEAKKQTLKLDGTCLDILHVNSLKNKDDKLAVKWVADGIRLTQALKTQVMLLPFFGKGALTTQPDRDFVAGVLQELAPEAQKAGVVLGLEDTISAEDNARILDQVRSKAVLVYYDVGNSTENGFDAIKEIRWLGPHRICQIHLKDGEKYLGEGQIDFPTVVHTIETIDFRGYMNLETASPSRSVEGDMRRNLTYIRRLIEHNS